MMKVLRILSHSQHYYRDNVGDKFLAEISPGTFYLPLRLIHHSRELWEIIMGYDLKNRCVKRRIHEP